MRVPASIRRCTGNKRGSAFIVVLLLVLILSVLGAAMLGLAASNMQMGDVDRNYQSVFYVAESGRDHEVEGLSDVADDTGEESETSDDFFTAMDEYFNDNYPKQVDLFDDQFGETVTATVTVEGIGTWESGDTEHTYTIVSEGDIGGVKRQVASDVDFSFVEGTMEGGYETDVGVFSLSTITLLNGTCVDGPVGANASEDGGIFFHWGSNVGDVLISPDADPEDIFEINEWDNLDSHIDDVIVMPEEREYPLPEYPDTPTLPHRNNLILTGNGTTTISQDGQYNDIEVKEGCSLNIDVGSGERTLVVDDFYADGDGQITVTGSGKLFLYVNNTFYLNINFNRNGDDRNVMIYYGGSDTFGTSGDSELHACVYVKDADIHLGYGVTVTGHIISGGDNVLIDGGMAAYVRVIYAPEAFVNITGGGNVTGAVIAKEFEMSGGGHLTYSASADVDDTPGVAFGSSTPPHIVLDIDKTTERDY